VRFLIRSLRSENNSPLLPVGSDLLISESQVPLRRRLALLASHLVVALVALVVVGGATRVMEAGLACPDWPLCYGSLLPGRQMNVQVFLEWFHRLDAFVVGVALLVQLGVAWWWRRRLPGWFLPISGLLLLLVIAQGGLGALTVLQLLPSAVVTTHLALALTLVALVSGLTQVLMADSDRSMGSAPLWWRLLSGSSLLLVFSQCLLGGRMATSWAAQRCLEAGQSCQWLHWHRSFATPAALSVLLLVSVALLVGGWARRQWPLLLLAVGLVTAQIALGVLTLRLGLAQPLVTVAHQLIASLLVALLAALLCRRPAGSPQEPLPVVFDSSTLEPAHG